MEMIEKQHKYFPNLARLALEPLARKRVMEAAKLDMANLSERLGMAIAETYQQSQRIAELEAHCSATSKIGLDGRYHRALMTDAEKHDYDAMATTVSRYEGASTRLICVLDNRAKTAARNVQMDNRQHFAAEAFREAASHARKYLNGFPENTAESCWACLEDHEVVKLGEELLKFQVLLRRILEATTNAMLAEQDGDSPVKERAVELAWEKFRSAYDDGLTALGLKP